MFPYIFLEHRGNYYFNTAVYGYKRPVTNTYPVSATLHKYNFATKAITKSAHIYGDTIQTDSVVDLFAQLAIVKGDRIYMAYNRHYPSDTVQKPHPYESISYIVLDTNLNVIIPERRLKTLFQPFGRFTSCHLQQMSFVGNRIAIAYNQDDSMGFTGSLGRYLLIDVAGNLVADSVAGIAPNPSGLVSHRINEIISMKNGKVLITGTGIIDKGKGARSFVITDTSLHPLDTFYFKPSPLFGSGGYQGYFAQPPNFQPLPTGSLIAARDYSITNGPTTGFRSAVIKLKAINRYAVDTIVVFPIESNTDGSHRSSPSIRNLVYQEIDNRVYYTSATGQNSLSGGCNGYSNFVQVMCLDTNLRQKWIKYLTPAENSCASVTVVTKSDGRPGIDVAGAYSDATVPSDTSRQGYFIYHIDSTGSLEVENGAPLVFRDRIRLYPNPTDDFLVVDDLLSKAKSIAVYDMQGKLLFKVSASPKQTTIRISELVPGNYSLLLYFVDGTNYRQLFTKR